MSAFQSFMTGLIDYAGLFPPAALSMREAAEEYQRWRSSEHAWMVGRFVCPVGRLNELARESAGLAGGAWDLSVLAGDPLERDLDSITGFLDESAGRFDVPSLEIKIGAVPNLETCLEVLETVQEGVTAYFELPTDEDVRGLIAALSGTGHGAKIRTGGLSADLFPTAEQVARFIVHCRDAQIPFKATAGLHHPLRHQNPSVGCRMHGFFNVFAAAALAIAQNRGADELLPVLRAERADAFSFANGELKALDFTLNAGQLERARRQAVSFGSCSIAEPVADLSAMGLLPLSTTA